MIQAAFSKRFDSGFHLNVEFEAGPGVTVLYGPSGAGKTLTLDCLAGFASPTRGRITLNGRILFDGEARVNVPPRSRACGYVFQNYALFPHMTLRANLAFAASNLPRLERHRNIAELLERFHIADLASRYPRELSGGQKQRASIARALIGSPKFLLLDEPGRGLDIALRDDLHAIVRELKNSVTVPILLVTHDLEECVALADRVLIYEAGQIVERGSPSALLRSPGSVKVAKLLGGFNIIEAEVLALDPGKQTSRLRMLDTEFDGPHLRGIFKGDRIALGVRPEDLRIAYRAGDNRLKPGTKSVLERAQGVRIEWNDGLRADIRREDWDPSAEAIWIEIPANALRQLAR